MLEVPFITALASVLTSAELFLCCAPFTYLREALNTPATVGTPSNITVCTAGNEVYKLTVTDANGLVSHNFVSVYVSAPPTVSAGADKDIYIGYGASCVSLDGYANNSMGPCACAWSNGSTAKTPSVCPSSTTNYSLTVYDSRGCTATDDVNVNVIDISCGRNKVLMCKMAEPFVCAQIEFKTN